MDQKLTIIMYHYIRDVKCSRYQGIKGVNINSFKEQLKFLSRNYNIVTMEEVIASYYENFKLPSKAVLLTFDDAYIDHFVNVFPILHKEHVQGSFYAPVKAVTEHSVLIPNKIHFILAACEGNKFKDLLEMIKNKLVEYHTVYNLQTYDFYFEKLAKANRFDSKEIIFIKRLLQVELPEELRNLICDDLFAKFIGMDEASFSRELYMNKEQMECMVSCGMHIGSHGYDHYWLDSLNKEQQLNEIRISLDFIKSIGGDLNNWTMCYPYGAYNNSLILILKEYGCKLGLSTRVDIARLSSTEKNSIFELPRLDTNDFPMQANADVNQWYLLA